MSSSMPLRQSMNRDPFSTSREAGQADNSLSERAGRIIAPFGARHWTNQPTPLNRAVRLVNVTAATMRTVSPAGM
jgi:hypothetical protein